MLDSNPAYETAYIENNMGGHVIDKNPQYVDHMDDEAENEDHLANSFDQLDDYDYMGNWKSILYQLIKCSFIQLLESPIPAPPAAPSSQKASSDNISGTKRGTVDPLVSKRPEKILNKKIQKKRRKKRSKMVKRARRTKSSRPEGLKAGPKGRYLEVGPRRGP